MRRFSFTTLVLFTLILSASAFGQGWYDNGWLARQPVIINNTARPGVLTDYSVKVLLTAANFNFAQAQPTGQDLRFTDSDGITVLPYWVQSFDPVAAKATLWAKVPSIPGSSQYTIYLYYANSLAPDSQNGAATFSLFSDFNQNFKVISPAMPDNFDRMIRSPECPAPLVAPGAPGEFDHWGYRESGNVLIDSTSSDTAHLYKMWYSAYHDSLYTTDRNTWLAASFSSDGYNWVKMGRVNPWTYGEDPYVVKVGATYFLYYEDKTDTMWDRVGLMTSTDALNWSYQGLVVPADPTRPYMDKSPSSPTVWVEYGLNDTTWYCFFEGKGSCTNCGGGSIGLATSHDGYHFTVYGQGPILPLGNPGEWDNGAMVPDDILKVGSLYWLGYHGHSISDPLFKFGLAYSTDLIHWTKAPNVSGRVTGSDGIDPQLFWDRNGALMGTEYTEYNPNFRAGIFRSYLCRRDTTVWPYASQWTLAQKGSNYGLANDSAGVLVLSGEAYYRSSASIVSTQRFTDGFSIEMRTKYLYYGGTQVYASVAVGAGNIVDINLGGNGQWESTGLQSGYAWFTQGPAWFGRMPASGNASYITSWTPSAGLMQNYNIHRFVYDDADSLKWYVGDTLRVARKDTTFRSANKRLLISQGEYPTGAGGEQFLDWVFVRKCVNREPTTQAGTPQIHRYVQVTSPNGGEQWRVGQNVNVTWTSNQVSSALRIELNRNYPSGSWETLTASTPNTGQFPLTVSGQRGDHCRIRVSAVNDTLSDISDADFSIVPRIVLTSPDGGEHWMAGDSHPVLWQADGVTGLMRAEINRSYPTNSWTVVADSVANTGSVTMLVTGPLSDSCRVRISEIGTSYFAVSDSNFTITGASLHVISPNGGEQWTVGAADTIRWRSQLVASQVRVELNRGYPLGAWEILGDSLNNSGVFPWVVSGLSSDSCRVRVRTISDTTNDVSDSDFRIAPIMHVVSPDGGERWMIGETHPVVWQALGATGLIRVEINRGYPSGAWSILLDSLTNNGSAPVLVTGPFSDSCRVRVSEIGTSYSAVSDSNFFISGASIHVLAPNGGESWRVGVPAFVSWSSQYVTTLVRIELNRNYPAGTWEILADTLANTGQYQAEVTGPLSDSCRVRVRSTSDTTISDVSNGDFRIVPDVLVISPNGGEQWLIHDTDPVQWQAVGWPGLIRLEINRNYPSNAWIVIADSLPNTGSANILAGDSLSETCRMRVTCLGSSFSDISDSNFAVTTSQGFLMVVRPRQPGAPVTTWDVGTVECPTVPADTFMLRNMGDQNVTVYYPPEPASGMFEERSSCADQIVLPPGQLSACEMVLSFGLPNQDGIFQDTLLIPTDAANQQGGFVRIPLSGHRVSTPIAPPLTINSEGNDIRLTWTAETQSLGGCALPGVQYRVFAGSTANGPLDTLALTSDTTFVDSGAVTQHTRYFYYVTTVTTGTTRAAVIIGKEATKTPDVLHRSGK